MTLAESLEAESAPMVSRSLDVALFRLFEPDFVDHIARAQKDFLPIQPNDVAAIRTPDAYVAAHAPHYTSSLDEALALVRKRLPAHENCIDQGITEVRLQIGANFATATLDRDTFTGDHRFYGHAETPALAVCAAMVRATSGPATAQAPTGSEGDKHNG